MGRTQDYMRVLFYACPLPLQRTPNVLTQVGTYRSVHIHSAGQVTELDFKTMDTHYEHTQSKILVTYGCDVSSNSLS